MTCFQRIWVIGSSGTSLAKNSIAEAFSEKLLKASALYRQSKFFPR